MKNCVYGCKIIHLSPFIIHQYVSFVRLRNRMRILASDSLSGDFLLHFLGKSGRILNIKLSTFIQYKYKDG
jgi:hypothetical protein